MSRSVLAELSSFWTWPSTFGRFWVPSHGLACFLSLASGADFQQAGSSCHLACAHFSFGQVAGLARKSRDQRTEGAHGERVHGRIEADAGDLRCDRLAVVVVDGATSTVGEHHLLHHVHEVRAMVTHDERADTGGKVVADDAAVE